MSVAMPSAMTNLNGKLNPHLVWLFALAAAGVSILATKLLWPLTPKTMGIAFFAIYGACATAAMFTTRTSILATIAAFLVSGIGLGIYYYLAIASAGDAFGAVAKGVGMFYGVAFALDGLAGGIAGMLFGWKLRKKLGPAATVRAVA
jgi:hypothetical protein